MSLPDYLSSPCKDLPLGCTLDNSRAGLVGGFYCDHAIRVKAETGRFFITMGHPGFNSRANNGAGYATRSLAEFALSRYSRKPIRVRLPSKGIKSAACQECERSNGPHGSPVPCEH